MGISIRFLLLKSGRWNGLWHEKTPCPQCGQGVFKGSAPTYSPTFYGSTIGSGGLNFSVRNGKRWTPPI